VDDVPTVLKTSTHQTLVSYGLPLKTILAPEGSEQGGARAWLPDSISQSFVRVHQQGVNRPPGFDPATHIPDQVTRILTTELSWTFGRASLGYVLSLTDLDNRQPRPSEGDFQEFVHGVSFGLQPTPTLRLAGRPERGLR
jgi:hypothetical protein